MGGIARCTLHVALCLFFILFILLIWCVALEWAKRAESTWRREGESRVKSQVSSNTGQQAVTMRPRPAMTHSAGTHTSHPLELSLTLQGNIVWVDRHERHGMGAVSSERQAAGCGGEQDKREGRGTSQSEPEQAKSEERNKMQANKERWSSSMEHGQGAQFLFLFLFLPWLLL